MSLATVKTVQKGRILIVDDEMPVCQTLSDILECEHYSCQTVHSVHEAFAALKFNVFDLVITDMNLHDISASGLDLIDHVTRHDDTIPVILITAFPSVSRAVEAMKRGALDFLTKPFDREILLHLVSKGLQERRLRIENRLLQAEINKASVIEKLNRELDRRIDELTRLYAISEGLNQFMDSSTIFDRIVELAAEVTGARRISVMLLDRSRRYLKIRSAVGLPREVIESTIQPVGHGIAGQVAKTGKAIRVTHHEVDDDLPPDVTKTIHYRLKSWMCQPLIVGGEIFGVVNLTGKIDGTEFTREDEQIMQTLVEKAGIKLENQALYEGIYSNLVDTLTSLVTTIEAKDPYTREHSQRVTDYAAILARNLKLGEEAVEMLSFAGMLHDIGKIGVRDEILTKAGRLTAEEYEAIKLHPEVGERIVSPLGLVSDEKAIIRHHHERFDGKGYPDQLQGDEIPLLARIVAVADAFDAMTTTRSYRRAMPVEVAMNEMEKCAGSQFDPKVVTALFESVASGAIVAPASSEAGAASQSVRL